jgi:SAM-dependent methyltransferase
MVFGSNHNNTEFNITGPIKKIISLKADLESTDMVLDIRAILSIPAVYSKVRKILGNAQYTRLFVAKYIRAQEGNRVLDIGCGPGDILNYLPKVEYVGFDIDEAYIQAARSRYGSRGTFFCRKVSEEAFEGENRFDIVLALGILHHLDNTEAMSLFNLSKRILRPGGRLITFDGCYVPDQSIIARWFLSKDRGVYVRTKEEYLNLSHTSFHHVTFSIHHDLLRIPYTILIMECTKE